MRNSAIFIINPVGVYSVIARLEPNGEAKSTAELYLSGKGLYIY